MVYNKSFIFGILLLTLVAISSCVKYSFKGALPSYLKTISVELFEDRSRERWVGLQEKLTEDVVNAFVNDNTLTVIDDPKKADLVIKGSILSIQTRSTSITQEELVEEQQLVLTVKVECLNQQSNKPLWSGNISEFGVVSGTGDLAEREAALDVAVEKIVEEIVNKTIAAW
ncbi:MAG: hypothetical protein D6748_09690 [Calditrichaeota bacterium]|nr:MAG: hypothetical protein D6748_09690 [Calditrichota bacterium]